MDLCLFISIIMCKFKCVCKDHVCICMNKYYVCVYVCVYVWIYVAYTDMYVFL